MAQQALIALPQPSAPPVVTSQNTAQALMMQAMLTNIKDPQQQASIQAALAMEARAAANRRYMMDSMRKLAPCLTNGLATQAYQLNTPMNFIMNTALNGFCEGIIIRYVVNYTLAAGTSAVYGVTPAGALGLIDKVEVRYNKSQHLFRPQIFKQLALLNLLENEITPEGVQYGATQPYIQNYLNSGVLPTTVGAQSITIEQFFPFSVLGLDDARGLLPIIVGDTGLQIIVNTPLAIFGSDPVLNSLYAVSGSGHAVSAVSGTVQVDAVYRDGEVYYDTNRLPFDMGVVQGTFQMQIDNVLQPLVAGASQRTKISIQGQHYVVLLLVVDGLQSNAYSTLANLSYFETGKDGVGANTFQKFGTQTNLDVRDWLYLNRLQNKQDLDQGVLPIVAAPGMYQADPGIRKGKSYLDNTKTGWPDFRFDVTPIAVGTGTLNGLPCTPRIEPHVFYVNPIGLVPV